jgi:hypothetical protein
MTIPAHRPRDPNPSVNAATSATLVLDEYAHQRSKDQTTESGADHGESEHH